MKPEKNFTASGNPRAAGIADATALVDRIREGVPSAFVFEHGSLQVKMYRPAGSDLQKPHARDEVYVVARGSGRFFNGGHRHDFTTGDMLFVPAGVEHRFESFTPDFCTWVLFYGPEGGELGNLETTSHREDTRPAGTSVRWRSLENTKMHEEEQKEKD
ncbi:MAG TPA: cupin domain-containing protein [Burkholderiales bacterium]|nr:cupin domain-containing protein [Burkholderiales bacterium]